MMKRVVAVGMTALMLTALSGCGGAGQPGNNAAGFIGEPLRRVDNAIRGDGNNGNGANRTAADAAGALAAVGTQHVQVDSANRQVNLRLTDWSGANGHAGANAAGANGHPGANAAGTNGHPGVNGPGGYAADATAENGTLGANGGARVTDDRNHTDRLASSALLITVPTGWTVNVLGATDTAGLSIVPYNFRAGGTTAATANAAGAQTPATPVVHGTANGMVFRATTPGQYAIVHRGGVAAASVVDVITVSNAARVPSVTTTHTWGTSDTAGTANTTVAY